MNGTADVIAAKRASRALLVWSVWAAVVIGPAWMLGLAVWGWEVPTVIVLVAVMADNQAYRDGLRDADASAATQPAPLPPHQMEQHRTGG